jgi:hypothetical protein
VIGIRVRGSISFSWTECRRRANIVIKNEKIFKNFYTPDAYMDFSGPIFI